MVGRLVFLVDTNVWLELLLEQERADEARLFFQTTDPSLLAMTEFTLYSLGIILTRLGEGEAFSGFILDTLESNGVSSVRLTLDDLRDLLEVQQRFRLDFDDAYQYVAAEKCGYMLVSFDSDFDRTDRRRMTPNQAITES